MQDIQNTVVSVSVLIVYFLVQIFNLKKGVVH